MEKKKILIVEDEPGFSKMLGMRLHAAGFEISVAGDAYSGTREALNNDHDLIILDLMMPAGGGFSVLDRIRGMPEKAMIPVVVLTGKPIDAGVKEMAKAYDVAAIFSKPCDSGEFVDKIRSLLPR